MTVRPFRLGRVQGAGDFDLPGHHLVTHAVCVGMTGSGKTGLCIGLVEEALRSKVPVLILDIKGDLMNLGLLFDELAPASFASWLDEGAAKREGKTLDEAAAAVAAKWQQGLAGWGLGPADVKALRESVRLRVITPGTSAGEPLHVLSPLEQKSSLWEDDEEMARESLSAAMSLLLRMVDREADPTRGREHVLLSHLAEKRLRGGQRAGLEELLIDLREPPIERVGALSVDEFLSPKERAELAQDLNALVASPTFQTWRQGAPLDVGSWMTSDDGRTPATIVSVAHLEDEERMLVLSLVLEQTLAWVRGLSGTTDLRALVLFDEVFGFLPPHPSNPPTKRPVLALLKQARAFGVGLALATQNPVDVDYKALSNAGVWFVGRLQTDADRERVVEGLVGAGTTMDAQELGDVIKALPPRTFFVRDVHAKEGSKLLETRWTLSWLRGPMTRQEIRKWSKDRGVVIAAPPPAPPLKLPPSPAPSPPEGWRAIFPFPPAAPVDQWQYAPLAAIVARAELTDAKIGYRESRRIALLAPLANGALDLSRVAPFNPEDFRHAAVSGASFQALPTLGARALKSLEKALRDQAAAVARGSIFYSPVLEMASAPGEAREAFVKRCEEAARARAAQERAGLIAKHEPKIQKLAVQRDMAHAQVAQATPEMPGAVASAMAFIAPRGLKGAARKIEADQRRAAAKAEKARDKLNDVETALAEAVGKRNAEIAARETELAHAAATIVTREIAVKKDGLVVEGYAVAWVAS
jgi:hypothetical protein